jgi:hypothetical protein
MLGEHISGELKLLFEFPSQTASKYATVDAHTASQLTSPNETPHFKPAPCYDTARNFMLQAPDLYFEFWLYRAGTGFDFSAHVFGMSLYAPLLTSASALNRSFRGLPGAPGGASYI